MTKRQAIADKLKTLLASITIAGGYKTDFPELEDIKHWKSLVEPKENGKFVSVKDRTNNYSDSGESKTETLTVEISFACSVTEQNYTTITNMLDDILKCIHTNIAEFQELSVEDIYPVSDDIAVGYGDGETIIFDKEVGTGRIIFNFLTQRHALWNYDDTDY